MTRWAERYTKDQRAAIVTAILDGVPGVKGNGRTNGNGCSARQAVQLAKEGKLPGMPPFEFTQSAANQYSQKEKKRRAIAAQEAAGATPQARMETLLDDLTKLLAVEVEHLRRNQTNGRLNPRKLGDIAEAAKKTLGLETAMRKNATAPTTTSDTSTDESPGALSLAGQLAAAMRASAEPTHSPTAGDGDTTSTEGAGDTARPAAPTQTKPTQGQEENEPGSVGAAQSEPLPADPAARAQALLAGR